MQSRPLETHEPAADYFLDITGEVCPLTFVRTKLLIERMPPGTTAAILLKGKEPLANVPRSVVAIGHEVIALQPLDATAPADGIHRLLIRVSANTAVRPAASRT